MKTKTAIILSLAISPAFAGSPITQAPAVQAPAESSPWWLTVTPYGWVTATEGDMGVAGIVAPVDISFEDTLEDLELSFMIAIDGGFDRWAFGIDAIYGAFSSGADLPAGAAPFSRASLDFDQFFGRIHAGYQVISRDCATLTLFAGLRYSDLSTDLTLSDAAVPDFSLDGGKSWIDPVIGLQGSWDINDRWFVRGGGDIGGFGVSSDLIWQANVALGYRFTDSFSALFGYRGLGVDYSDGGFLVDTIAHGPAIGLSWRF